MSIASVAPQQVTPPPQSAKTAEAKASEEARESQADKAAEARQSDAGPGRGTQVDTTA